MAREIDLSDNTTSGPVIDSSAATALFYQTLFDHFYGLLDRFGSTDAESIDEGSLIKENKKYLALIDKYQSDAKSDVINLLGNELTSAFPGSEYYGKSVENKITLQIVRDAEKDIEMSISMHEKIFINQGLSNGLLKMALLCHELGVVLSNKSHQDKSISFMVKSNNLLSCWLGAYKYNRYLKANKKIKREPSSKKTDDISHVKNKRSSTDERKIFINELIRLLSKKEPDQKYTKKTVIIRSIQDEVKLFIKENIKSDKLIKIDDLERSIMDLSRNNADVRVAFQRLTSQSKIKKQEI